MWSINYIHFTNYIKSGPPNANYFLPLQVVTSNDQNAKNSSNPDKDDIYNLGVILLELLTGRQITSDKQVEELKLEVL